MFITYLITLTFTYAEKTDSALYVLCQNPVVLEGGINPYLTWFYVDSCL